MPTRLVAALEHFSTLTPEDRMAIQALVGAPRSVPADTELVIDGQAPADRQVLLEGQAFRHKTLPDGRRQIMGFLVPGDILDFQGLFFKADYGVTSLTACLVAPIPNLRLNDAIVSRPNIARALWGATLVEAAMQRGWMVGMGRRSAQARVAHLLCEVFLRLRNVGLTHGDRCRFPVTQTHLADAAGLSGVHTNRVLQSLRQGGLISLRGRELIVHDWAGLAAMGEFEPSYLHLPAEPALRRPLRSERAAAH